MKARVCDLVKGDVFEMWGCRFEVQQVANGRIYYRYSLKNGYAGTFKVEMDSVGAKSQQFVNLIAHGLCRKFRRVIPQEKKAGTAGSDADGPATGAKDDH